MYAHLINTESQIGHPDSALQTKHCTCLQSVKALKLLLVFMYPVVEKESYNVGTVTAMIGKKILGSSNS